MTTSIRADTAGAVADAVCDAYTAGRTLEVVGSGSRRGYGRPGDADAVLDVSGLAGIVDYDPAELVLTARPGTRVADIAALAAEHGQYLAFDPPDLAPVWGGARGAGTIGGMLALGLGGSRRVSAGAPRDYFLGFAAVNGRGEPFSAGGKVIKNVTGYDLPKLMAGSLGTLAVLTEVTIKMLPAPRSTATLEWPGLGGRAAIAVMTRALASAAVPTGAAFVPDHVGQISNDVRGAVRVRLEGVKVAVDAHAEALTRLLAEFGSPAPVDERDYWHDVGAVDRFAAGDEPIWRISLPATAAADFVAALDPKQQPRWYLDWGGALVWLTLPSAPDGHAVMVRRAIATAAGNDGHATLFRAPDAVRRVVAPFQPLPPALAALTDRVRARFDPGGVLNPGRMVSRPADD